MTNPAGKKGSSLQTSDASRAFLATLAQWTGGLSPQAFGGAWLNVLSRLVIAPGRQAELARSALQKSLALARFTGTALRGASPAPEAAGAPYAGRFSDPAWAKFPFNVLAQSFLAASDLAREAVKNVPGADAAAENIVGFTVREGLELVAPDNYLPTNPQLIRKTVDENGRNLLRGAKHLAEDVQRTLKGLGPVGVEQYEVGKQVASTPGKVVLRTPLMELIQYSPQTRTVYAELRKGRMVIVVDDADRENEGDLILAAQFVTPAAVNFMAKHGRGLICAPTTSERLQQLGVARMVRQNRETFKTDFQVSVDATRGITTGISAGDRAETIRIMADPTAVPEDLVQPGHVFPLRARPGGVLQRAGHTEAAVDLVQLAGCRPIGVICEIMSDDGSMARLPELLKFSRKHGLKICTIADLIDALNRPLCRTITSLSLQYRSPDPAG